jgi:hypothetical protein
MEFRESANVNSRRRSARFLASDGATDGPNAASDQRARGWLAAGQGRHAGPSARTKQAAGYGAGAGGLTTADKAGARCKKHGECGYPHGISPFE